MQDRVTRGGASYSLWIKALIVGSSIIIAAEVCVAVFFYVRWLPNFLVPLLRFAPLLAGLAVSVIAPRYKVLAGALVAVPATMIEVLGNAGFQALGHPVDFGGWRGAIAGAEMGIVFNGAYAALGAVIGWGICGRIRATS